MSKLGIVTGTTPNDGTGDNLLSGAIKINSNFDEIYNFFGDGTNLTGSGVTSITAGSGISVDQSTGNVTITATGGGGGGGESYWQQTSAGIHTLSNVGIGTTNPTSVLTVKGNTSLETLNVSGVSTFSDQVNITSSNSLVLGSQNQEGGGIIIWNENNHPTSYFHIYNVGNAVVLDNTGADAGSIRIRSSSNVTLGGGDNSYSVECSGDSVRLFYADNKKFETTGAGVTITGTTFTNQLSVSGISTLAIGGAGNSEAVYFQSTTQPQASLKISQSAGNDYGVLMTFTSSNGDEATIETDSNSNLIVSTDGTLNLRANGGDTLLQGQTSCDLYYSNVKKFETTSTGVSIGGTVSVDGGVKLVTNNETIVGTSGTVGEIKRIGGAPFFYDGSAWREFVLSSGTPVSVPADTEWDSVVFRATFDDDYTDAKFGATPVYVSAGSSIVGAAVTIGTGAYRNDGSIGAGISYAYRSDYDFTGSWTIEFWMYVDSDPVYSDPLSPVSLVSMHSTTGIGTSGNWSLAMYKDLYGNVYITWFNQNGVYVGGTTLYSQSGGTWSNLFTDKWNHLALVRQGNNGSLHFYVNGTEASGTSGNTTIDNDILNISTNGLNVGGATTFTVGNKTFNSNNSADVIIDDMRISCGVGTAGQRYTSIGIHTYATFTPPTTALPTTGTLSSYVQPPADKYGEITLGVSPTWRGTSGVTVSQQSSGNYRVSFASTYTNSNDYYVLSQGMDQGFASYVGIARSITHVDLSINKQSDDSAVDTGSLAVQIKNHI